MKNNFIITSERWSQFVNSTAMGLQLSLALIQENQIVLSCTRCPFCGEEKQEFTNDDIDELLKAYEEADGKDIVFIEKKDLHGFTLDSDILVLVGSMQCGCDNSPVPLENRAKIAKRLLFDFFSVLGDGMRGGKRAVELSTLRQMNHMALSMFKGDEKTTQLALDLILCALVILAEASGSWIEYNLDGQRYLFIKGDRELVEASITEDDGEKVCVDFSNDHVVGRLGVILPEDYDQAKALLALMSDECLITFEIDNLLRLLREQVTIVLGSLGSAVLLVNLKGVINYANSAYINLFSKGDYNIIGMPLDTEDNSYSWSKYILGDGDSSQGKMELVKLNSTPKWVDWSVFKLKDRNTHVGWIVMIDDKTDYYNWQEASLKADRFSTTASLVGSLAHEIRNPLTSAMNLLQLISRQRSPERALAYADLISRELDRVNRLLSDFLLLGKPAKMSSELVRLDQFISQLYPLLTAETIGTQVELINSLSPVSPVMADEGQLTQVILNIVRNAIEALGDEGVIEIETKQTKQWVELVIKDNGPGVDTKVLQDLYQPFFTTKEKGTGLGLPITKAIINNHGGRIIIENAPRRGAVVTIQLPAQRFNPDTVNPIDVIITSRNEVLRHSLEHALRSLGVSVFTTHDPGQLLSLSSRFYPKILVIDNREWEKNIISQCCNYWKEVKLLSIGDIYDQYEVSRESLHALEYADFIERIRVLLGDASAN